MVLDAQEDGVLPPSSQPSALAALLAGGAGNFPDMLDIPPDADDETMVELAIALSLQDQVFVYPRFYSLDGSTRAISPSSARFAHSYQVLVKETKFLFGTEFSKFVTYINLSFTYYSYRVVCFTCFIRYFRSTNL